MSTQFPAIPFRVVYPTVDAVPVSPFQVQNDTDSGLTPIQMGVPVKIGTIRRYVTPLVDAEPTTLTSGTNTGFVGMAMGYGLGLNSEFGRESTETSTEDGLVNVTNDPNVTFAGSPKVTLANQAALDAIAGKRVLLDLTSDVWTVDTGAADSANNGVLIVGGNISTNEVYFKILYGAQYIA